MVVIQAFYDDINLLVIEGLNDTPEVSINGKVLELINKEEDKLYFKTDTLEVLDRLSIYNTTIPIVFRNVIRTNWFLSNFDATDKKMGSWVEDDKTYFSVYAPLATSLRLLLGEEIFEMKREKEGHFTYVLDRNLHGKSYLYEIDIYDKISQITDPFAKASLPNRNASVVVDFEKLDLNVRELETVEDPIILEASVRDFSSDLKVKFKHPGKFLGMLESHGKYGMAHVLDLGITHLQLMPVNDFETVDELDQFKKYNWGYDPMQYMVLEGSYSSDIYDATQIIKDFAKLVDTYHKHGIGINLDVVFNHVYDVGTHPLHILFPYYHFRYTKDNYLSNGSFCGNEVASEMPMTRKLIVETALYFLETFKVDGYRFDLMGLTDVDTMNIISTRTQEINPKFMIYGEGWTMPTTLEKYRQASIDNQFQMPRIGHFNDRFRNVIGGDLNDKDLGYASGNFYLVEDVKAALTGNSDTSCRNHIFNKSSQSINYVECHDNMTLADKIALGGGDEKEALFINAFIIFAQGIPFLQIGQSFFRNKKGEINTYKSSDEINHIDWSYLDKYEEMNNQVKEWIKLRKEIYKFKEGYSFKQAYNLLYYYYGNYEIIFNPGEADGGLDKHEVRINKLQYY